MRTEAIFNTPYCGVQSSPLMDYLRTEFANTAHCVCPLLTWRIPRKSVCTTTTRATWCTHRPTPRQPTPDRKEFHTNLLRIEKEPRTNLLRIEKDPFRILAGNGVSLLHYPAFLYQKLACFQMFFMQMLIYYLFIEMKTALTIYLLHYIVGPGTIQSNFLFI